MIEELERLLSKATPGPWGLESTAFHTFIRSRSEFVVGSQGMGGHGQDSANAAAIVALVNAAPALIAAAEAVVAWDAADRQGCLGGAGDLDTSITAMRIAEAQIRAAAKGMREVEG